MKLSAYFCTAALFLGGCAGVSERLRAEREYCENARLWAAEMEKQGVDRNDTQYLYYKKNLCSSYENRKKNSTK